MGKWDIIIKDESDGHLVGSSFVGPTLRPTSVRTDTPASGSRACVTAMIRT
jgi:hypothetical protein